MGDASSRAILWQVRPSDSCKVPRRHIRLIITDAESTGQQPLGGSDLGIFASEAEARP